MINVNVKEKGIALAKEIIVGILKHDFVRIIEISRYKMDCTRFCQSPYYYL